MRCIARALTYMISYRVSTRQSASMSRSASSHSCCLFNEWFALVETTTYQYREPTVLGQKAWLKSRTQSVGAQWQSTWYLNPAQRIFEMIYCSTTSYFIMQCTMFTLGDINNISREHGGTWYCRFQSTISYLLRSTVNIF